MIHAILATRESGNNPSAEERRNLETIVQGTLDFNARRQDAITSDLAPDYEWTSPFFDYRLIRGPGEALDGMLRIFEMLPDSRYEIRMNIAQGPYTETRFEVTGTSVRGFLGFSAQDTPYRFVASIANEFDPRGQRLKTWEVWDRLDLLRQLGGHIAPRPSVSQTVPTEPPAGRTMAELARGLSSNPVPPYLPGGGRWRSIEKRNYESVSRGIAAFNAQRAEESVADLSIDSVWRSNAFPKPIVGKAAAARYIAESFDIFPDTVFELVHMQAWRNYVQALFLARGTVSRGFLGLAPRDHRPFQYFRSVLSRYNRRGERVEVWDVWDEAAVLRDQGFIPWNFAKKPAPLDGAISRGTAPRTASAHPGDRGASQALETHPSPVPPIAPPAVTGQQGSHANVLDRRLIDRQRAEISPRRAQEILETLARIPRLYFIGIVREVEHSPNGRTTWGLELLQTSLRDSMQFSLGDRLGTAELRWAPGATHAGETLPGAGAVAPTEECTGRLQFADRARRTLDFAGIGAFSTSPGKQGLPGRFGTVVKVREQPGAPRREIGLMTLSGQWPPERGSAVSFCVHMEQVAHHRHHRAKSQRTRRQDARGSLSLVLDGTLARDSPVDFSFGPRGEVHRGAAQEILRLMDSQVTLRSGRSLLSRRFIGRAIGRFVFEAEFPRLYLDSRLNEFQIADAHLRFQEAGGRELGGVMVTFTKGRMYRAAVHQVPVPVFSMAAAAPLLSGTGLFEGAHGMVILNTLHTAVPHFINSCLSLELSDPKRELVDRLSRASA